MARATEQTLANCLELNGLIKMFGVDAETEADKMALASCLLAAAIGTYTTAGLTLDDVDEVLKNATDVYRMTKQNNPQPKKKK